MMLGLPSFALLASLLSTLYAAAAPLESRSTCPATPASSGKCTTISGDAPWDVSCDVMKAAITCPNGISKRAGGIVLLVHGTGSNGQETWGSGPYYQLLPGKGSTYDICWVDLPGFALDDAQVSGEYVAYAIYNLAPQSATCKVSIIAHSQGNLNTQWALGFWPSTQSHVAAYVSLAGDFKGTAEGPIVTIAEGLLEGGAPASVYQQTVGSKFLSAVNKRAGSRLVPTLSIYTLTDDIIQPEVINPTSALSGATLISTQSICPLDVVDHFIMTITPIAFYLAYDWISGTPGSLSGSVTAKDCSYLTADTTEPNPFSEVPGVIEQAFYDGVHVVENDYSTAEPALKKYVCAMGAASSCSSSE